MLNFDDLREANIERIPNFRMNSIFDWSETDWACAAAGELGEACNLIKKRRRGEKITTHEVAKEIADTVIYLDLLAARVGINLGETIRYKFNEVSIRVNSSVRL